jgi:hypothetical protein
MDNVDKGRFCIRMPAGEIPCPEQRDLQKFRPMVLQVPLRQARTRAHRPDRNDINGRQSVSSFSDGGAWPLER